MAFATPGTTQDANISVIFRNEEGLPIGQTATYLAPARGHSSAVLSVTGRGVAEISSPDAAISALGIRSHNGAFTSVRTLVLGPALTNRGAGAEQIGSEPQR